MDWWRVGHCSRLLFIGFVALALGAFGVVTEWSLLRIYFIQTAAHYLISWLLDIGANRGNG